MVRIVNLLGALPKEFTASLLLLEGLGAKDPGGERCGTAGREKLINQVGSGSLLADIIIWHRLENVLFSISKSSSFF